MAKTRDMTVGSPARLLFGFFVPLLFGLLFQQMYNTVDTVVVGRFLGVNALAGVGATGALNFLILGFCTGTCSGFAIPVAQKFGEHDFAGLKRYAVNAIMLSVAFSLVVGALVSCLCRAFLEWMNTPADIIDDAFAYLFVIFLGIPVVMLYNVLFGIIRSMGDSRTPVLYLIVASLINVALDLLLIVVFHTGVEGAAVATVISQAVSALLCVRYIRHSQALIITKEDWKPDWQCCRQLLGMGLPMGLQYSITAIGSIMLQTGINGLGSHTVAAVSTGNKVTQLICCPLDALGTTVATYGGQNIGAKKLDRISEGMRICVAFGLLYSAVAFFIIRYLGPALLGLFIGPDETAVLADAQYFILHWVAFCAPLTFVYVFRFMIQGLGFSKLAVFAGVFEMLARGLSSLFWIPAAGFEAVCFASPMAWIAADVFLVPAYLWVRKKLRREFAVTAG